MGFSLSGAFSDLKEATGSTLNAFGEGITDGLVRGIQEFGAQPEAYNQPATGEDGAGRTLVQQQSGAVGVEGVPGATGLPSWVVPAAVGGGVLLVAGVLVLVLRK